MPIFFLPLLAWITISDLRSHRVPNSALIAFAFVGLGDALINGHDWAPHLIVTFIVLTVATIGWKYFGLGMGDVKFIGLLALLLIPVNSNGYQTFVVSLSFAAFTHLAISTKGRFIRDKAVPLAPSLSLATVIVLFI